MGLNRQEHAAVTILARRKTATQEQVIQALKSEYGIDITARRLRMIYADIRRKYANGDIYYSIVHDKQGNYLTSNPAIIAAENEGARRQAYSLLRRSYDSDRRALSELQEAEGQISFRDYVRQILAEGGADNG